ncbi:MAG: hypothetical protein BWY14_00653 [Parcubacteria group bacterium ADurb.Bin192]|nr:MAG: hypothetical protein BWY14_00653 [Parcubacteria group bacterium ADurb.Bin192]
MNLSEIKHGNPNATGMRNFSAVAGGVLDMGGKTFLI